LRKHTLIALVALVIMTFVLVPLAAQENRVALVIGNEMYGSATLLSTPATDATEVAGALARNGFRVTLLANAGRASIEKSIREFGDRLKDDNTVGLFYYAGQGAQADGRNFLLPVDSDVKAPDELSYNAVDMESVLAKMRSAGNKLNIAVIDASHENPYPGSRKSNAKGLAEPRMRVPESLIVFSAQPGASAPEGDGPDSAFAREFIQQVSVPNQDITVMMKHLISQVRSDTSGRQVPWVISSLTADFSFASAGAAPAQVTSAPVTAAPPPPPAALPDLATLDTTGFVKSLPQGRITAISTKYGYYAGQGELAQLDARMPPLVVDAYSYAGVKNEKLHILLFPHELTQQIVLYLRSPSGKTAAYFPTQGTVDASASLAENGTYILLVGTPDSMQLGPYFLNVFGRGSSMTGELTIFDPADPDVFGNHIHSVPLDLPAATVMLKLESGDFDTAIRVLDANGKSVEGKTESSGKTTTFTFVSGGGHLSAVIRSDGNWPTGKWKLSIQAVGLGGGS
jgi:hypothetical protein